MPKTSKPTSPTRQSNVPGKNSVTRSRWVPAIAVGAAIASAVVAGVTVMPAVISAPAKTAVSATSAASTPAPSASRVAAAPASQELAQVEPSEALPDNSAALRAFWAQASELKGFETGSALAATRLVVMFDPQCIHCAHLWQEAASLKLPMRITWVPVGLLGPSSRAQAAHMSDNFRDTAALDAHERKVAAQGPLRDAVPEASAAAKETVAVRTKLLLDAGVRGVPLMLVKTVDGQLRAHEGSMSAEMLRRWAAP